MYHCPQCRGDFTKYATPGQCPLCGAWETIQCVECGYRGAASFYLDNDSKCPRCSRRMPLPGQITDSKWLLAGLVLTALIVVSGIAFLVTR